MDLVDFGRFFGSLLVTLGLLGAGVAALRRFGPQLGIAMAGQGGRALPRRVEVVESRLLDPRRRLVVARFDGRDHLILIGAQSEQVIASGPAQQEEGV